MAPMLIFLLPLLGWCHYWSKNHIAWHNCHTTKNTAPGKSWDSAKMQINKTAACSKDVALVTLLMAASFYVVNRTSTHCMMELLDHIDTWLMFVHKQNTLQLHATHALTLYDTLFLHYIHQHYRYCTLRYQKDFFCKGWIAWHGTFSTGTTRSLTI